MPEPSETDFGPYRLLSRIGHGGMGVTWKAVRRDAGPGAVPVVLKRILPDLRADPELIESFVNEAHVTAALSHPNIAQVLDFGRVEGEFYFAVELIHGRTVEAVLEAAHRRGLPALPVPVACVITLGVLSALQYAHTRMGPNGAALKIVHRDISPDNVIVGFDGQPRVIDFGVAKARYQGREETKVGLVKGKWSYFSPEQATGERLDGRSDLFTVGVMLYRMVSGRMPFDGVQMEAVHRMLKGDRPSVQALNPSLPAPLVAAIDRALEVNREKRFQSAALMATGIATALQEAAPGAGRESMQAFMQWAFEEELEREGIATRASPLETSRVRQWIAGARRLPSVSARPNAVEVETAALTRGPARPALQVPVAIWAAVGLFLVGAGVTASVFMSAARQPMPTADFESQRAQALRAKDAGQQAVASQPSLEPDVVPGATPAARVVVDTVSFVPGGSTEIVLQNPRHNLNGVFEPRTMAREVKAGETQYLEPSFRFPVHVVAQADGLERIPVPHGKRYLGDSVMIRGPAAIRLVDFVPPIVGAMAANPRGDPLSKEIGVDVITENRGNFLIVDGLDHFVRMTVRRSSRAQATDPDVVLNCGGESQLVDQEPYFSRYGRSNRKTRVPYERHLSLSFPSRCAFALIGADTPKSVTLLITGTLAALRDPKLPLLDSNLGWRPLDPWPERVSAETARLAQSWFYDARANANRRNFYEARHSLESCVRALPASAECHLLYGYTCSKLGERSCAKEHYREFLRLVPAHPLAGEVRAILEEAAPDDRSPLGPAAGDKTPASSPTREQLSARLQKVRLLLMRYERQRGDADPTMRRLLSALEADAEAAKSPADFKEVMKTVGVLEAQLR